MLGTHSSNGMISCNAIVMKRILQHTLRTCHYRTEWLWQPLNGGEK